jgi:hypothetical protein
MILPRNVLVTLVTLGVLAVTAIVGFVTYVAIGGKYIGPTGTAGASGDTGPAGASGETGPAGMGFKIRMTFSTADECENAHEAPVPRPELADIMQGEFAMVVTDDPEMKDNGRLYCWDGSKFVFVIDFSDAHSITGPAGPSGLGITFKGPYSSTTAYSVNDIVTSNSSCWICIQANTGVALTDTTSWRIVVRGFDFRGSFTLGGTPVVYQSNQTVRYNGSSYVCKMDNTMNDAAPDVSSNWALAVSAGATGATGPAGPAGAPAPNQSVQPWNSTKPYVVGDMVMYNAAASQGNGYPALVGLFRAEQASTNEAPSSDVVKWKKQFTGFNDSGADYMSRMGTLVDVQNKFQIFNKDVFFYTDIGAHRPTTMTLTKIGRTVNLHILPITFELPAGSSAQFAQYMSLVYYVAQIPPDWLPASTVTVFCLVTNGTGNQSMGRLDILPDGTVDVSAGVVYKTKFVTSGTLGFGTLTAAWIAR